MKGGAEGKEAERDVVDELVVAQIPAEAEAGKGKASPPPPPPITVKPWLQEPAAKLP
jgi:hypothetical protein